MILCCLNHAHFGDCWMTVQYALRQSVSLNQTVFINPSVGIYSGKMMNKGNRDRTGLLTEMLAAIDCPKGNVSLTTEWPNATASNVTDYFPTKTRWQHKPFKRISYQFDVHSRITRRRVPSERETITDIRNSLPHCEMVKIGLPMTLEECIATMSNSAVFLGVNSGMLHVARCVGVPTVLIRFRQKVAHIYAWHGAGSYILVEDISSAIELARRLV